MTDGIDSFASFLGLVTTTASWLTTDSARIAAAGGAGGIARWATTTTSTLKEFPSVLITGVFTGIYLWPIVLKILGFPFGGIEENLNNTLMAAFVTGAGGMSILNIALVMLNQPVNKEKEDE